MRREAFPCSHSTGLVSIPLLKVWKPSAPGWKLYLRPKFSWDKICDLPALDPKFYVEAIINGPKKSARRCRGNLTLARTMIEGMRCLLDKHPGGDRLCNAGWVMCLPKNAFTLTPGWQEAVIFLGHGNHPSENYGPRNYSFPSNSAKFWLSFPSFTGALPLLTWNHTFRVTVSHQQVLTGEGSVCVPPRQKPKRVSEVSISLENGV